MANTLTTAEPTLDTIITWQLAPEGTGTRLTLTHEGFDLDSAMGRQAFEGMKPGWPGILARIGSVTDAVVRSLLDLGTCAEPSSNS